MKHFVNPVETYRRDYQLIPTYLQDCAKYLSLQTGRAFEECLHYVSDAISPTGQFPLQIPEALVLVRNKLGDRERKTIPVTQYLNDVVENQEILSPTMAAYVHPDKKESLLARYIAGNLKRRKVAKKEMFMAGMRGDEVTRANKNAEQNSLKIKNNSLSGAHSSPHTILWNKSSHSTLTSTCRTATSYGNANNEKFLYGNRHYWSPDVVKANIVSVINHTDMVNLEAVIRKYKLAHPTVEQTMACIKRSTDPYWRSANQTAILESLVKSLKPVERSAFVYISDFYHLAAINPDFVRTFLTDLSVKVTEPLPMEEAEHWVGRMDDNLLAFVSLLCAKELAGGTMGDADKKNTPLKVARPDDYGRIAATAKKIIETLDRYEDFIRAFWVTPNLPTSIFYLPNIVRRGVITSDTDSTIFTVQYWTEWYRGQLDFSEESMAIAATMVYLASQLVRHILATISGNMGVAPKDITRLSMKNEYYFPVFVLTSRAKHYFAYIAAQEGNVYTKMETEIKGVALRNSNVPPEITKEAHALIRNIMDTVMAGKKISLTKVKKRVAKIENNIRNGLLSGSYSLMTMTSIKGAASYKDPESSNYIHYGMWEEVFADKYGHAPVPPYRAVKVSVDADNPTKLRAWLSGIEDRVIADKMEQWLQRNGRRAVTMLLLPEPVLAMRGVPPEIVKGIAIRDLIFQTMESFYLILESLGVYMRNNNITRLVSDAAWLGETAEDVEVL